MDRGIFAAAPPPPPRARAQIAEFQPHDATTNPSLVNAAARLPEYAHLVDDAVAYAACSSVVGNAEERMALLIDKVFVNFGVELTKHVPGFVSIEVDARLSYHTAASLARARRIIALCAERGVPRERILVKLAATWEGIQVRRAAGRRCACGAGGRVQRVRA